MLKAYQYFSGKSLNKVIPNRWDITSLIIVLGIFGLFCLEW